MDNNDRAAIDDACRSDTIGAWRVSPDDPTEVQTWKHETWISDCWLRTADEARQWVATNIREADEACAPQAQP